MSSIRYRPEIDGLRAVAVLAVLIYHAGFGFLPGGFMGVDIFFVISGFLITSFIVEDIRTGQFSIIGFWERRARRILPPLFVVISATLIAGWCLFLPFDFVQLGKEMASQSMFGSNILFMLQGGYFDDGDQFKALLHTWSLAVEEQFYLFYPIGMAIFARFFGVRFFYIVLPAAIISFALCIWMSGISDRMAFYALPFRGWELLGGAIIALLPVQPLSRGVRESVSILGIIMMAVALFLYEPIYAFPGWVTLLPVIGAMFLIWGTGMGATLVGCVLSLRPFVAIGLISYSLYLWHWPVIIFAHYVPIYEFTASVTSLCLLASAALAYLTWRFVEQPIRKKRILSSRKSIFITSLAGLSVIAIIGLLIVRFSGFPERFPLDVQAYAAARNDENPYRAKCDQPSLERVQKSDICQTNPDVGKPNFIVWGDSFADAMAPAFYKLSSQHNRNGYVVTGHGCPPVLDAEISMPMRAFDCRQNNQAVFDLIVREKIQTVFLIGNWNSYLLSGSLPFTEKTWFAGDKNYTAFERIELAALQRTIDLLRVHGMKNIYIVKDVPYMKFDPPRILAQAAQYNLAEPTVLLEEHQKSALLGLGAFENQSKDDGITYIDPSLMMCDYEFCYPAKNGQSFYFNPGHISRYGAEHLTPIFKKHF